MAAILILCALCLLGVSARNALRASGGVSLRQSDLPRYPSVTPSYPAVTLTRTETPEIRAPDPRFALTWVLPCVTHACYVNTTVSVSTSGDLPALVRGAARLARTIALRVARCFRFSVQRLIHVTRDPEAAVWRDVGCKLCQLPARQHHFAETASAEKARRSGSMVMVGEMAHSRGFEPPSAEPTANDTEVR